MTASYGLLTYLAWPEYNAGDYIQSLAAAQFLPRIDKYINREKLNEYNGAPVKMILNGWFMHKPGHWPPSGDIHPLVTSFHLNSQAKDGMLNSAGIEWFRKHAPIGCRDEYTQEVLTKHDVETYLSGCLTSTFENTFGSRTNDIYFVDVLFRVPGWSTSARTPREFLKSIFYGDVTRLNERSKILKDLFADDLFQKAKTISHYHPARHSEKERFEVANCFLEKYATAKLVVTSRLHCALPCLAFGTPVIFVHSGFKDQYDTCRLKGVTDLFNTIFVDDKRGISANFKLNGAIDASFSIPNPDRFRSFVPGLRKSCNDFIRGIEQPA
jgi:hypothetical protein